MVVKVLAYCIVNEYVAVPTHDRQRAAPLRTGHMCCLLKVVKPETSYRQYIYDTALARSSPGKLHDACYSAHLCSRTTRTSEPQMCHTITKLNAAQATAKAHDSMHCKSGWEIARPTCRCPRPRSCTASRDPCDRIRPRGKQMRPAQPMLRPIWSDSKVRYTG